MNRGCWFLLRSGDADAAWNMAIDEALMEAMPRLGRPALRFYGWTESAASFGYFQKIADIERLTPLRPLVRRPTAGGLVPHDADWTYSVVFPATHEWYSLRAIESYRRVHEWVRATFERLQIPTALAANSRTEGPGQCFAGYEQSDVLWRGKKIAGAAQRRTRQALLIQGSVQPPPVTLSRRTWEDAMRDAGVESLDIEWESVEPDSLLLASAKKLALQKYSQAGYNRKR